MSYIDKVREKYKKKAREDLANSSGVQNEWVPDFGKHKIRIFPPIIEDDLFYHTHSYHFIPSTDGESKGRFVYSQKKYEIDEKQVKCPIDVAVNQWYQEGRAHKNDELLKLGGKLKRKRHFFFPVIRVDEEDPDKKFAIIKDSSNEGKLVRIICGHMGIPFYRDIDDNWVDKTSLEVDEEKPVFDLIDIKEGCDFTIDKRKTGSNNWDISYEQSYVGKKRALTDDELKLLEKRVDLRTIIAYEGDYNIVKSSLDEFVNNYKGEEPVEKTSTKEETKTEEPFADTKKKATKKTKEKDDVDEQVDSLLDELDE